MVDKLKFGAVAPMWEAIEESFAASSRTPKGRKARQAIFRAMRTLVVERGLQATSLDRIADRAGLTQAALRHHFPTRDELLTAFLVSASLWFRARVAALLAADGLAARDQLEHCISWHLEYMENVETAVWLETSAYWLRHPPPRRIRDDFYQWLGGHYARLIGKIQPALGARACRRKAYALLSLVLGAWITHGRGSAVNGAGSVTERRQVLIDAAMEIATQ
jgi:AcrR family transcriptional regulator